MRAVLAATIIGVALGTGALAAASRHTPPPPAQTPPPQPAPAQPPAAPAAAFPPGAKVAYLNLQRVANESVEGKASTTKVQALNQKKVTELNEQQKALQAAQQKLQQGENVLNAQARSQLEREIDKMQRDIQRFTQDAQAEVQDLQQDLQEEFQRRLFPVIQQIAAEMGLHMILSPEPPVVWADPALDITGEVIKRFDALTAKPAASKPPLE